MFIDNTGKVYHHSDVMDLHFTEVMWLLENHPFGKIMFPDIAMMWYHKDLR